MTDTKHTWPQRAALAAALLLSAPFSLHAATHDYEYTLVDNNRITYQSAAGAALEIGDVVNLVLRIQGGYWSATAGQNLWAPIGIIEQGSRTGNITWSFLLDGILQDSGSQNDQSSEYVHIAGLTAPSIDVSFDEFRWSYTFTAISGATAMSTLREAFFYPSPFYDQYQPTFHASPSPVPVPAAGWLLGSGLAGLAGMARRRSVRWRLK